MRYGIFVPIFCDFSHNILRQERGEKELKTENVNLCSGLDEKRMKIIEIPGKKMVVDLMYLYEKYSLVSIRSIFNKSFQKLCHLKNNNILGRCWCELWHYGIRKLMGEKKISTYVGEKINKYFFLYLKIRTCENVKN